MPFARRLPADYGSQQQLVDNGRIEDFSGGPLGNAELGDSHGGDVDGHGGHFMLEAAIVPVRRRDLTCN